MNFNLFNRGCFRTPGLLVLMMLFFVMSTQAQPMLSAQTDSVLVGEVLQIPIDLDYNSENITSWQFELALDTNVVRLESIDTAGTMSEGLLVLLNDTQSDRIRLAAAGAVPFSEGTIVNLNLTGVALGNSTLSIDNALINEKPATTTDGFVYVKDVFLPIDLVEFSVRLADPVTVIVRWVTASESNVALFEVLRREATGPGNSEYTTLGNYASQNPEFGAGYSWIDHNVLPGIYEYRMRATDFDGSFLLTAPEIVTTGQFNKTSVWPNPFDNQFTIHVQASESRDQPYEVYNVLGQRVAQGLIPESSYDPRVIDLSHCPNGLYLLSVFRPFGKETQKILKI